jgi:hypothetical protein
MLPKEDRSAMLLRIFNDTSPLINIAAQKNQKAVQDAKEAEAVDDTKEEVDVADLPSPEEPATEPVEAEEEKMETA